MATPPLLVLPGALLFSPPMCMAAGTLTCSGLLVPAGGVLVYPGLPYMLVLDCLDCCLSGLLFLRVRHFVPLCARDLGSHPFSLFCYLYFGWGLYLGLVVAGCILVFWVLVPGALVDICCLENLWMTWNKKLLLLCCCFDYCDCWLDGLIPLRSWKSGLLRGLGLHSLPSAVGCCCLRVPLLLPLVSMQSPGRPGAAAAVVVLVSTLADQPVLLQMPAVRGRLLLD